MPQVKPNFHFTTGLQQPFRLDHADRRFTVYEIDDLPPAWAIGPATALVAGAQLCTRDGRKIGNAVIRGPEVERHGLSFWPVLTDAGNELLLTSAEVAELFWPPEWLMDPATAPGARG